MNPLEPGVTEPGNACGGLHCNCNPAACAGIGGIDVVVGVLVECTNGIIRRKDRLRRIIFLIKLSPLHSK